MKLTSETKYKILAVIIIVLLLMVLSLENTYAARKYLGDQPTENNFIIYDIPLSSELQLEVFKLSRYNNLDYTLVLGIIQLETEGTFDVEFVSSNETSSDQGLMQINSTYQDWYAELAELDEYDVFNSSDNIKMGMAGLVFYRDYWESKGYKGKTLKKLMMLSYNRGISGASTYVKKHGFDHAYTRITFKNQKNFLNYTN